MVKTKRPVDLPLLKIRLPVGGVISIIHRITGALLVLILPLAIYWLDRSLQSQAGFNSGLHALQNPALKLVVLISVAVFLQHLFSGVRHLLLDLQIGLDRENARRMAWAVPGLTIIFTVLLAWAMFR